MKETANVKIRVRPSTRLRLKRLCDKIAKKNKVVEVVYDEAISMLLDNNK